MSLPVIDLWFDVVIIRGKAVIAFISLSIVVPTARWDAVVVIVVIALVRRRRRSPPWRHRIRQ
jgi:hypothetical protein